MTTQTEIQAIAPKTLKQWLEQGQVTLVDVREPSEYAGERIPGAHRVSLSSFDPAQIPTEADKTLILYCESGSRSSQAARRMIIAGYESVIHLEGGMNAWKQAGFLTQVNKNAPISIMRQVQIIAGTLILTGTLLGAFVNPAFLFLSGFVGAGLTFAGVSGTCAMAMLLAKLPYNQQG
ncbi:rhodanese-like domain-containing protein [Spirulina sp. CCNP1310]|uniref:rhodanese-like domain-containing protein n=1 Tax=Spirulina sp. CCNP1310 TaxID=3110249 RepID=UPI002B21163C|nr:rhodanese-like domain-containing protein [Spirulina sp. CCNP1310]MEA5418600.1 rhodanese-like domain-containing protein [Spirulina sp. CCNP1310]